jgi:hypothetical protein
VKVSKTTAAGPIHVQFEHIIEELGKKAEMYIPGKCYVVHMDVLVGLIKICIESRKTDSRGVKSMFHCKK